LFGEAIGADGRPAEQAAEKVGFVVITSQRGIGFFANAGKNWIPQANPALGMTLLEIFRTL
jgi:hypothetical protein